MATPFRLVCIVNEPNTTVFVCDKRRRVAHVWVAARTTRPGLRRDAETHSATWTPRPLTADAYRTMPVCAPDTIHCLPDKKRAEDAVVRLPRLGGALRTVSLAVQL